jgi:hypothetical protein
MSGLSYCPLAQNSEGAEHKRMKRKEERKRRREIKKISRTGIPSWAM